MNHRAVARHPSSRSSGGHLRAPVARLVRAPSDRGVGATDGPHRVVAVATMAVRGAQRRSRAAFAAAYGISEAEVERLEAGWVDLTDIPRPLEVLTPLASLARFGLGLGPPVVGLAGGGANERVPVDERLRELVAGE